MMTPVLQQLPLTTHTRRQLILLGAGLAGLAALLFMASEPDPLVFVAAKSALIALICFALSRLVSRLPQLSGGRIFHRSGQGRNTGGSDPAMSAPTADEAAMADLPVALLKMRANGDILFANNAAKDLLGLADLGGCNLCAIMDGMERSLEERLAETRNDPPKMRSEMARRLAGGRETFLRLNLMRIASGLEPLILAALVDATELKLLQAQFVQSQKMQAVGQLAGGVAHDFNNLLTAINGHCDLLLLRHESGDFDFADLMQIRQNSNRAAALVRQLLAFSRKQTLQPKVIRLPETLAELAHLLNRLLSERVSLSIEPDAGLAPVRVDERQFEQVIMNLVVNARDAMPLGGAVQITCKNLCLATALERDNAIIPPGDYVLVQVKDTGTGMVPEQLGKIFEPFYTTKRVGEGTGLGLSTAYGIIKQTGGFIFAESEPGKGTTFSIYLPAARPGEVSELAAREPVAAPMRDLSGQGRILLAEDEGPVRSFAARALRLRGYVVQEAASGDEALQILADSKLVIDMLISDVIMPGLDGPSWVRQARRQRPNVKVIFVSGYTEDAFGSGGPDIPNSVFLPKPFSLAELTQTVKEQFAA